MVCLDRRKQVAKCCQRTENASLTDWLIKLLKDFATSPKGISALSSVVVAKKLFKDRK